MSCSFPTNSTCRSSFFSATSRKPNSQRSRRFQKPSASPSCARPSSVSMTCTIRSVAASSLWARLKPCASSQARHETRKNRDQGLLCLPRPGHIRLRSRRQESLTFVCGTRGLDPDAQILGRPGHARHLHQLKKLPPETSRAVQSRMLTELLANMPRVSLYD